jgi:mannosyltransferase
VSPRPAPPLVFDGIVFRLQRTGGISVLFTELLRRLPRDRFTLVGFQAAPPPALAEVPYRATRARRLERYRRATFGAEAELFHSTYYRVPAARGPRVVTSVYDFVYERFSSGVRRAVHVGQKGAALARSDRIICISESTRRDLLTFCGVRYEGRTVVVPLAAAEGFRPLPGETRRAQVLFVGARGGYKNFAAVVEALGPLRDISLRCVGGGPFTPAERRQLEATLPGRYEGLGYLPDEALNREYNRSLCLAYPSRYEGFGIPVLEAMRAGCPVVAVGKSSIPEVAGDAALLLERGDVDELRAAFTRLRDGPESVLVERGFVQASRFSWDETARRTRAVYEELLGRSLDA